MVDCPEHALAEARVRVPYGCQIKLNASLRVTRCIDLNSLRGLRTWHVDTLFAREPGEIARNRL